MRHLDLNECFVSQTILFALADMIALESLDMMNVDMVDIGTEDRLWPTITFPKLKRLSLAVNLRTLIVLIAHIAPTLGCYLEYESENNTLSDDPSTEDILLLRRGLTAHFQCFSEVGHDEAISWMMTKDIFQLNNALNEGGGNSRFYFRIEIKPGSEWHWIPDIILTSLYCCDLSSFTTLELDISQGGMDPSNLHIIRFYRSLASVHTMYTDSQTMELLLHTMEHVDGIILLPCLETIVFDTDAELKSDVIMRLLIRRRDAGVPITIFDLVNCTSPHLDRLLFLEGIDDLDVDWNEEIRGKM